MLNLAKLLDAHENRDLYATQIRRAWTELKAEGRYPCLATVLDKLPHADRETVTSTFFTLCRQGEFQS